MPKVGIKAAIDLSPQGVPFPESWIRVSNASGDAESLTFQVEFYANEESFDQGYQPLATKSFTIPYPADSIVSLVYGHLLTLNLTETDLHCDITQGELITRE